MHEFIPVNTPLITEADQRAVAETLANNWVSSEGPAVSKFEREFSKKIHRKFGVAVTNGTAALELAFKSLKLKPGDEVILPAFTIISCALAVIKAGAKPVFVDVDEITCNINTDMIEQALTSKTRAILVVHTYYFPSNMDRIESIAKKHDLIIVEDAAEMYGQSYRGRPCGSFGVVSTFSFYANKIITTGEGGMVVTNCEEINKRCRYLRDLCFNNDFRFKHEELSSNYRMTSLQAALGCSQNKRLTSLVAKKRAMGKFYSTLLQEVGGITLPVDSVDSAENIYWIFGLKIDRKLKLDSRTVMKKLAVEGVGTRPFFYPLHKQPALHRLGVLENQTLPVSEHLHEIGFYIPSGLGMSFADQEVVAEKVKKVFRNIS